MERRAPDAEVARAINRVLAAERETAFAIEAAQIEAEAMIEAARAERRRLVERARVRASRLHVAAQSRLDRLLERLEHDAGAADVDIATLNEFARSAVDRLANRLTAAGHGPR
jgi:cell division septum initiation protein DivIVA